MGSDPEKGGLRRQQQQQQQQQVVTVLMINDEPRYMFLEIQNGCKKTTPFTYPALTTVWVRFSDGFGHFKFYHFFKMNIDTHWKPFATSESHLTQDLI